MKRVIAIILLPAFLVACAGQRTPETVSKYQFGDENKPCRQLGAEIVWQNTKIAALQEVEDGKSGSNLAITLVGLLFLPLWFLWDFSDDEMVEIGSRERRNETLQTIMVKKTATTISRAPLWRDRPLPKRCQKREMPKEIRYTSLFY